MSDLINVISSLIAATAALGTASYALVDGSKAFWGGVSNNGFVHIKRILEKLFPNDSKNNSVPIPLKDVKEALKARWLNGVPLAEQKATAKSLIKLRLNEYTAKDLANATGVKEEKLKELAKTIAEGGTPKADDADFFNRFDLMLTTIIDRGYQQADQAYRNKARVYSIVVSVILALLGGWLIDKEVEFMKFLGSRQMGMAFLIGLAATPVAPIAKDLTSALSAGVKAAQMLRK
ncbi:MAG: hypothetical protein ABFD75_00695 [Smithella sp.]